MDNELLEIANKVKNAIYLRQKELNLSFVEDTHTYTMNDINGESRTDFPSVSTVLHRFYTPFPEQEVSLRKAKGDVVEQQRLLAEWKYSSTYAINIGSRTHYHLEKSVIQKYGNYKQVREPIFECDEYQTLTSESMIKAGIDYIQLMHDRGAVLIDTEIVLGDNVLGYVGQPDKIWLIRNKNKDGIGFIITDWKTNNPKNFLSHWYTKKMLHPFEEYDDTSLTHYYIQLPLYCRLFLSMLKGSEYEDINFMGGVVVLLKDDGNFVEYRIPNVFFTKVYGYGF